MPRLTARPELAAPAAPATLRRDASQLVIGATGTLGPAVIDRLATMGAGTVVAVSRNPGEKLAALTAELAARGVTLVTVAADAADPAAMAALFARFGADLPNLDGIYLAALAGGPALLATMTDADVAAMFAPKLDAIKVLHDLSLHTPVRHFVAFSSITGVIGSRWLAHYTAAGAYLDTFAAHRRTLGLPATVVDWGLWRTDQPDDTTDAGLAPMAHHAAIAALPALLAHGAPTRTAVVDADWPKLAAAYRTRTALHLLDDLVPPGTDPTAGDGAATAAWPAHWAAIRDRVEQAATAPAFGTLLGGHVAVGTTPPIELWQARLDADTRPYPTAHRVHGVEVVPVSVLIATLAGAAGLDGATALHDVAFTAPITLAAPRTIQVVADGDAPRRSLRIDVAGAAGGPASTAVTAQTGPRDGAAPPAAAGPAGAALDPAGLAALAEKFGVDGQPLPWTIRTAHDTGGGVRAVVELPQPSPVAVLDAAVHLARLGDTADTRLLLPAGAESAWLADTFTAGAVTVQVRRRAHGTAGLVVDVTATGEAGVAAQLRGLRFAAVDDTAPTPGAAPCAGADGAAATPDWAGLPAEHVHSEIEVRLQAILARELGMPAAAVGVDRPFPELGLDSMMAMNVLREAKKLLGMDLSATRMWDYPTISALAGYLTTQIAGEAPSAPAPAEPPPAVAQAEEETTGGLLDALFDSVESGSGNESGI